MKETLPGGFEQIVAEADDQVAALAREARALLIDIMPELYEVAWPRQAIIGYGIGPKKMSEHFCYIAVLKQRINLGFYYGADLADPAGLLEGGGKNLRHIKVRSRERLQQPELRALVEAASQHLPKL